MRVLKGYKNVKIKILLLKKCTNFTRYFVNVLNLTVINYYYLY